MRFHKFTHTQEMLEAGSAPGRFNNPFGYEPHPLCQLAAREVVEMVGEHSEWHEELKQGKMFGVLVV